MANNPEIITLTSRDNDKYTLIKVNEDLYKASLGDYCRIGYKNEYGGDIQFVDPSGGPFIEVDTVLVDVGRKVKSITDTKESGILIEFKEQ